MDFPRQDYPGFRGPWAQGSDSLVNVQIPHGLLRDTTISSIRRRYTWLELLHSCRFGKCPFVLEMFPEPRRIMMLGPVSIDISGKHPRQAGATLGIDRCHINVPQDQGEGQERHEAMGNPGNQGGVSQPDVDSGQDVKAVCGHQIHEVDLFGCVEFALFR